MELVICKTCDSSGYIIIDGKSIMCKDCNGKGYTKRVIDVKKKR